MSSITILVTGSNGQLGSEFKALASKHPAIKFLFTDRELLAIDDGDAIDSFFEVNKITHCINCAAYTAVDKAEKEADLTFLINATAVQNLAMACSAHNVQLVHFSTDYVFDGAGIVPYTETDKTDPINLYAQSKLEGEKLALQHNEDTLIIRTSWVYSSFGKNFVKTMMRLMRDKESIGVVADQFGSPTYAADLAQAVLEIITQHVNAKPGIYHYCNEGVISWYQFATAIKELTQSSCIVNSIQTHEYPTPAKRPSYSALDTTKIQKVFDIKIPHWKVSLKTCLEMMK